MIELLLANEAATAKLADRLAKWILMELPNGPIEIGLSGDLGSGKTTFVKYLASSLGIVAEVSSPTFVLAAEYIFPSGHLEHWDLYRIRGDVPGELLERPKLGDLRVIEWIERSAELADRATAKIFIEVISESERRISITGAVEGEVEWG